LLFVEDVDALRTAAFVERVERERDRADDLPRRGAGCERAFDRRGRDRADRSERFFGMIRDLFQPIARSDRNARGIASTSP